MATTTPNFGWTVPTSSDLVKNGAVAIETLGDAIDASLVDLKGGTTGQVLSKATGTDMDFSWITPSAGGGGKVLQVVQGTTQTAASTTSASYTDTNLTATITPSSSSSKVLVMVMQAMKSAAGSAASNGFFLKLFRGATAITGEASGYNFFYLSTGNPVSYDQRFLLPISYLDSPATTSATTYKTQQANYSGTTTAQYDGTMSTIILMEIGA